MTQPSNALPRYCYGDPADIIDRAEQRTCAGCAHIEHAFGRDYCGKAKPLGKRCKLYQALKQENS
ncbi:hypothetical protein ACQE3E_06470 [Methylomonas sp. MED-D]|uniref:hypothetical protein n=1 Tax=Methylomonas sp. MED-D TaxID=3418768 RepID=UPI003D0830C6